MAYSAEELESVVALPQWKCTLCIPGLPVYLLSQADVDAHVAKNSHKNKVQPVSATPVPVEGRKWTGDLLWRVGSVQESWNVQKRKCSQV